MRSCCLLSPREVLDSPDFRLARFRRTCVLWVSRIRVLQGIPVYDLNHSYGRIMATSAYPFQSYSNIAVFDRDGSRLHWQLVSEPRGQGSLFAWATPDASDTSNRPMPH